MQGCEQPITLVQVVSYDAAQALQVERQWYDCPLFASDNGGQALAECAQADGFEQAVVHADAQAFLPDFWLSIGGVAENHTAWALAAALFGANGGGELIAVHVRHVAIEDQYIEQPFTPFVEAFAAVTGSGLAEAQVG
ncbi:hypothetical protein D3C76_1277690 [compost metagenome]